MSDLLHNLGQRIRKFRTEAQFTQKRLAEAAGISVHYAGEIERGESSPSLSIVRDLASALGVKIWELFYFPSEAQTPQELASDIARRLEPGNLPDVEGLILIRELVKRMTAGKG